MAISDALIPEFDDEIAATKAVLERVPENKLDWKPHDKSMSLGRLATHLAELPGWGTNALTEDELDFAPPGGEPYQPVVLETVAEMVALLEKNAAESRAAMAATDDDAFMEPWTLKAGGQEIFTAPRYAVVRRTVLNHLVHHRGQLTVYLRLNDVPVPATFGPSADEAPF